MIHVVSVTPIWQRPVLTAMFLRQLHMHVREAKEFGIRLEPIIVGSERWKSRTLAEGFRYVEHENSPLGAKYNAGFLAARDLNPRYATIIGSDCLFLPTLWEPIAEHLEQNTHYVGIRDLFMWDPDADHAVYWPGYPDRDSPIGPMRFMRSDVMDSKAWSPYTDSKERGLDASADKWMPKPVMLYSKEHLLTSIKTPSSLTKIAAFERHGNAETVHSSFLYRLLAQ